MSDRNKYMIGFYVLVEAEGVDEADAAGVAMVATGWPLDSRVQDPLIVHGYNNRRVQTAKIRRGEVLMVRPKNPFDVE